MISRKLALSVDAMAAGKAHGVVALESGSVTNWGSYWTGTNFMAVTAPPAMTNAIAVAAGSRHDLALKADGTIAARGLSDLGQTNVPGSATNLTAFSADGNQSLALKTNGTVVQWGQTNAPIPANATNVIAIDSGTNFHVALLSDSTVIAWGTNTLGTNVPSGPTNVVAIAAGGSHALALTRDGKVAAWGSLSNVPAGLSNVMNVAAGENHSLALKNDGTVVAWGDSTFGQTNVPFGLHGVKLIAGGGDFSLGAVFSPLVQYAVDVSKDLLLICNTNSTNSIVVMNYYLAHRPMVGGAIVLGFGCSTSEAIDLATFTNQIVPPVNQWLSTNPTKRPQYIILFPDLPSRVWTSLTDTNGIASKSVAYGLTETYFGITPFVTSINMGLCPLLDNCAEFTNDCIAYINKLHDFGTTNSPGKLIISASAGGYGNTNYVLDGIRHGTGYALVGDDYSPYGSVVSSVTNALLGAGVPASSILFTDGQETCDTDTNGNCIVKHDLVHPTGVTNVAGYICWGAHSSLGNEYPVTSNTVAWTGHSGWWIVETLESFNGQRNTGQGNFTQWFSRYAFGPRNYSNTPVGAVSHTDEPHLNGMNDAKLYFSLWAGGKSFAISAWNSRHTQFFQAVGDPFVSK